MSTSARLGLAAVLCLVALGLGWEATPGSEGYTTAGTITPGICTSTYDGYLDCTGSTYQAGYFIPGSPDGAARGFEADARVVLVPAAGALVWLARRRPHGMAQVLWAVAGALGFVSLRAAGDGQVSGATIGALVVVLVLSVLREPVPPQHRRATTPSPATPF